MELTKDAYEYLLHFADDKDILNMLSVNKKFRDEKLFERIMKRKYPLLLNFKTPNETYKSFFIKMVFYISRLQEEYDIPYISVHGFNPKLFYTNYSKSPKYLINTVLNYAVLTGKLDLVQSLIDKGGNLSLSSAVRSGNLNIVQLALEKGANDINEALYVASSYGHLNIVKYLIEKGATNIDNSINVSNFTNHPEIVEYLKGL